MLVISDHGRLDMIDGLVRAKARGAGKQGCMYKLLPFFPSDCFAAGHPLAENQITFGF